jgi:hypothetical protein
MQHLESSVDTLARRIAKLEAQNRRLKKVGICALLVAVVVTSMGQATTDRSIEASQFILKDASGTVRASLKMEYSDSPELRFYDRKGSLTAELAGNDYPVLLLQGPPPSREALLTSTKDMSGVVVFGKDGAEQAGLGVVKEKTRLHLSHMGGPGGITLDVDDPDGPSVVVTDNEGFNATLGKSELMTTKTGRSEKTSAASLVLFGKDGKVLWSAP